MQSIQYGAGRRSIFGGHSLGRMGLCQRSPSWARTLPQLQAIRPRAGHGGRPCCTVQTGGRRAGSAAAEKVFETSAGTIVFSRGLRSAAQQSHQRSPRYRRCIRSPVDFESRSGGCTAGVSMVGTSNYTAHVALISPTPPRESPSGWATRAVRRKDTATWRVRRKNPRLQQLIKRATTRPCSNIRMRSVVRELMMRRSMVSHLKLLRCMTRIRWW